MEPRYPAPFAQRAFDPQTIIDQWAAITREYALKAWEERHDEWLDPALLADQAVQRITVAQVDQRERTTGHDVVAFLQIFVENSSPVWHSFIHYGLTSQDLVDNALLSRLRTHTNALSGQVSHLVWAVNEQAQRHQGPRPGRTHGQLAEVTSLSHQLQVWNTTLAYIGGDLARLDGRLRISKNPGPTGHTPLRMTTLPNPVPSTQVVARDHVLAWAMVYARLATHLENLALQIRLGSRAEVAEVMEGRANQRIGSSAMPHKKNPVDCEKVTGLARIVRGHCWSLSESVALWEDRDLTNSSAERIACAAIAQFTEHMVLTMHEVMTNLVISTTQMTANAAADECWTSIWQGLFMKHLDMSFITAGDAIRQLMSEGGSLYSHVVNYVHRVNPSKMDALVDEFDTIQRRVFRP